MGRKPVGPSGLGGRIRPTLALPARSPISALKSPSSNHSNALSIRPSKGTELRSLAPCARDEQNPREEKGLDRGHSASWSEAQLAWGSRPWLPPVSVPCPTPLFTGPGPTSSSRPLVAARISLSSLLSSTALQPLPLCIYPLSL